jgi:ABC-type multidrug transport system fused ATPase/permease subunit
LAPGPGAIEFRDVHFGYRANRPVLDGVSFRIEAGQHVGLIGPSGAGKTTLTDLLNGLYQPQSGEILIDGQPIAGVSTSSVRAAVRGVAVDGTLFRMSIADNVRYGSFDASDDAVREAAQRAGLAPLLDRLPEGLATAIGERGAELSAGERQRVLIARAFLSRPRVIVLDEATANLDFRTEASVKEALREISHGRTSLIVAHRKTMLTEVDRVLVLRGGHIEQDGAPAELVRQPGYFRDLMAPDEAPAGS